MSIKRFRKIAGKIVFVAAWLALGIGFIVIFSSSVVNQRAKTCNNINITINHDNGLFFISEKDVKTYLIGQCGDSLKGMNLKGIDFAQLEERLETNPYISNAEIYSNIKGDINVEIEQKEPIIRVVNNKGVSYYIDRFGEKIPLSPKFTARVAVATGNIGSVENGEQTWSKELFKLGDFVHHNEFWRAQFEQIYVTEDGDFELVPKLGNHIVRIGQVKDLESKFKKLMIFYKEVLKNVEADRYRVVDLKYQDQIVCSKNKFYGK